jgi:hypothetical protein
MIDWTPVTTAIVALIATMITTFIPMAIKLFFEAQSARLVKVKQVVDANQKIVADIVAVIQQTMGALTNSDKYHMALGRATEALHLPENTIHDMIELAVFEAKKASGESWGNIGVTNPFPPEPPVV